jgi:DHA3 family macrolide efflux protein-like MFS transporter
MAHNWKRNAALFIGGQNLSLFGSALVQYAIAWHVTLSTGSGGMMTLFVVIGFIPTFLITPFAGVWADRFNRKYVINCADGVIALATLVAFIFFASGHDNIWALLACVCIRSFGQGVQSPAVSAFIPLITPGDKLTRINGINSSIQSFTMLIAPMAAGLVLSFLSIQYIFLIDIITALIGIAIVFFFVHVPQSPVLESTGKKSLDYFRDIKEGIAYIKTQGWYVRLIILNIFFFLCCSPVSFLTPLQVTREFGEEVWRLTANELAFSIGMTAGGIIISTWGGFKNKVVSMFLANVIMAAGTISLGLVNHFWIYIAVMASIGIIMPLYNVPAMTLMQTKVAPEFMGRAFSVFSMMSSVLVPIGMLIFGPLADRISIDLLLIITGSVILIASVPYITSKTLREAGKEVS